MAFELNLSSTQEQALAYALADPQFFIQSSIEGRANAAIEEICALEIRRCTEARESIPSTSDLIVAQAFAQGTVRTAAEVEAERLASQPVTGPGAPTVASIISDRQFFQGLAIQGEITQEEALAAVKTGDLPQRLEDYIAQLPTADQFTARMLLSGATTFQRNHPMVAIMGDMIAMTSAELDTFWNFCSTL